LKAISINTLTKTYTVKEITKADKADVLTIAKTIEGFYIEFPENGYTGNDLMDHEVEVKLTNMPEGYDKLMLAEALIVEEDNLAESQLRQYELLERLGLPVLKDLELLGTYSISTTKLILNRLSPRELRNATRFSGRVIEFLKSSSHGSRVNTLLSEVVRYNLNRVHLPEIEVARLGYIEPWELNLKLSRLFNKHISLTVKDLDAVWEFLGRS